MLNKHSKAGLIACVLLSLISIPGCAKSRNQLIKVKPVKSFSLGSAHFTPFKQRPTAKELYDTAFKLYDSFNTVAASCQETQRNVRGYSEQQGKATDIEYETVLNSKEYRAKEPNKSLIEDNLGASVINGKHDYFYNSKDNTYINWECAKATTKPTHSFASRWFGLSFDKAKSIGNMKLLKDTTIRGTEVYVLRFTIVLPQDSETRHTQCFVTTVYLGKQDLLPRKLIRSYDHRSKEDIKLGIPADTTISNFSGIVANSPLPDSLFPPHSPKGKKLKL